MRKASNELRQTLVRLGWKIAGFRLEMGDVLLTCPECFAAVEEASALAHRGWHKRNK